MESKIESIYEDICELIDNVSKLDLTPEQIEALKEQWRVYLEEELKEVSINDAP